MKKAICILFTMIFSTMFVNTVAVAQVKISLNVPVWDVTGTCPPIWSAYATISIIETNNTDFYGTPGANNRTKFDLRIALPPGWTFDKWAPSTWRVDKSSNLQNGSGVITYQWEDVDQILFDQFGTPDADLWPDVAPDTSMANTITLTGLECKNQNGDADELILSNIRIKLIPMPGMGDPSGNFYAWTEKVEFGPPSGPVVYNLPMIGTSSSLPVVNYQPGDAEGIAFVLQPENATTVYHDVQERVKGEGWTTTEKVYPTIAAIDCNGYTTTKLPTTTPVVSLTLVDALTGSPISPNPSWWDGTGPTYVGSTPSVTSSSTWTAGEIPLQLSVMDTRTTTTNVGDFKIKASATVLSPGSWAISNGIGTIVTSDEAFKVRKRQVAVFSEPLFPEYPYDASLNNMFVPIYGSELPPSFPESRAFELDGTTISSGDPITMNLLPRTVSSLPLQIADGRYVETAVTQMQSSAPNILVARYYGLSTVTGPGFYVDPSELNTFLAFNAFFYVSTGYYNFSSTSPTPTPTGYLYLDPRYINPTALPLEISPLPVELVAFGGQMRNDVVTLKWTTATETNNYGFDVERSFDRASWSKVGFVQGNGTTSSQHDYRFEDRLAASDLQNAAISYRLRQIDRDGKTEYSQVVTLSVTPTAEKVTMLQNYPNPFNPTTNISFYLPASDVVTLIVYNELGVEVARVHDNAALESGWHTTSFRAGSLPSGLYAYRLQTGAGSVARTMVVAK